MTTTVTQKAGATTTVARPWIPAAAPLMTRWAKDVNPHSSRPEYPRPQFIRRDWMSLNGLWSLEFASTGEQAEILVPFTFEASLSGLGRGQEVHERIEYRRTFEVPAAWAGKRVVINFGAVDWEATVVVNGREVGTHVGGYNGFSFDITDYLKGGEEELVVKVFDPAAHDPHAFGLEQRAQKAFQPMGKQLGSVGIWYTRSTGIWQSVWLEPVAPISIKKARVTADPVTGEVVIKPTLTGDGKVELTAEVTLLGEVVGAFESEGGEIRFKLDNPKAWTPESPTLYDLKLSLFQGEHLIDEVETYFAFRTIAMEGSRITLNGAPYFLRGVLDQGYWPDGIYTAPTVEAMEHDIQSMKAMGFNLARKHAKIEDAYWYYLCDRYGLLVAQDMPTSQDLSSEVAKTNYRHEWTELVERLADYACVALWIPFNENWGNPYGEFQDEIVEYTRTLDDTRLIIDASGWTQRDKTDIVDHHNYTNNLLKNQIMKTDKPQWFGEYGGIAYPIDGHTWSKWWGYQRVKSGVKFISKIDSLTRQITDAGIYSGFCFTQLTDVEQELNGLMTYDRIPKVDLEDIRSVFGAEAI